MTAPYWIHFLRGLPWYIGRKGDSSWMIDPLVAVFWILGLMLAVRRRNAFRITWGLAPLAGLVQDASRCVLQGSLAGAALGGVAIAGWLERWPRRGWRNATTAALVLLATVLPLGPPALGAEAVWLLARFPRMLDWSELRRDAAALPPTVDRGRLVHGYAVYVVSGLAAWRNIEGERGHWVEVQPRPDPTDEASAGDKVLRPRAATRRAATMAPRAAGCRSTAAARGVGARPRSPSRARRREAEPVTTLAREAAWIGDDCEHNAMGDILALLADPGCSDAAARGARVPDARRPHPRRRARVLLRARGR